MNYDAPYEDPYWQDQLFRVTPKSTRYEWLKLVWEPGDRWEPIGRWFVYTMTPTMWIDPDVREMLEGPNPRSQGYFEGGLWVSTAPMISMRQWLLYRETGCWGRPFWVVQGQYGGHKYRFSETEQSIIELQGGNPEAPAPGDLPYSEPNQLTFNKLLQLDRLRQWTYASEYAGTEGHREEARKVMREQLWHWLSSQAREIGEMAASVLGRVVDEHAPRMSDSVARQMDTELERAEEDFIRGT